MSIPPPQNQNPGYSHAPSDTQAISIENNYPATGAIYPPGQHPRVKSLLSLTLGSAAIFALTQILGIFTPVQESGITLSASSDSGAFQTDPLLSGILGLVVGLALYALVYSLIKKGKKSGRITGIVFCILGTIGAFFGIFSLLFIEMPWGLLSTIVYLAFFIVNIFWLMRAFHSDTKANLV